jgi:hypothetical protein
LDTVKEIVFSPDEEYMTVCGPTVVAVAGVAPEPKFHKYEVTVPVEVLVKVVDWPVQIVRGLAVKLAVGVTSVLEVASQMVIFMRSFLWLPLASVM